MIEKQSVIYDISVDGRAAFPRKERGKGSQLLPGSPPHLDVYQQPLHRPVRSVDHQVKVELLDEQELELQDLLQHSLLPGRGLLQQVAYKLSAGDVELVHLTGQVSTGQPVRARERDL